MSSTIGIIGCGWLGLPLARVLLSKGHPVHGSTTSDKKIGELRKAGINSFKILLAEDKIEGPVFAFLDPVDILIVNIPPKLRGEHSTSYVRKIERLYKAILNAKIQKIIFISSTSVYGNLEGEVTELTKPQPATESGKQLLAVEDLFRQSESIHVAILRFGGLIGPDRHPVTFLSGKGDLQNGDDPVNLIHLNDCIGMILFILQNEYWDETYNGVYPDHPAKREYYTAEAIKRGLPLPGYDLNNSKNRGKRVISRVFLNKKYCFSTPIND